MKSVLIANASEAEIEMVTTVLNKHFNVLSGNSPEQTNGLLEKCDLLVLDSNLTKDSSIAVSYTHLTLPTN